MIDPHDPGTAEMALPNGAGALIGYARVSTPDQDMALQIEALERAGCQRIFTDVASGARSARPGLEKAVSYLRPTDTLIVWKIDRLGRSLPHLVQVVEDLRKRGVGFRSLTNAGLNTTTPDGILMFNIFAALAEFERELIRERTRAGMQRAKESGRAVGRRKVATKGKLEKARKFIADGLTVRQAAKLVGIGKTALYGALNEQEDQCRED